MLTPDDRVLLSPYGALQARVGDVDLIIRDALTRYPRNAVPADVLLDIANVLHPERLRPAVPVVPGRDGPAP